MKPMKAISAVPGKVNVVAALSEKSRYSGLSNEMARFIPSLSLIHNQRHYCQLSERKLSLIALRTRIPFVVMVSEFSHFRINHSTHFAENHNHINGIENFWNQAKRHLHKFNCIPKEHFELYLKECEWRFNNSEIKSQISILKQFVKGNLI